MPKAIKTVDDLLKSKRFRKSVNVEKFNSDEIVWLGELFNHVVLANRISLTNESGKYSIFAAIANTIDENAINRFNFLVKNSAKRTKETYAARYGENLGNIKWQEYVEKQKTKNLFETKKSKYGWSKEDFVNFNKSRAMTLELCVLRHGSEHGEKLWADYCNKQRFTNTLEYFSQKHGASGYDMWYEYNRKKGNASNVEWVMTTYNVSEDEAKKKIADHHSPKTSVSIAELKFIEMLELRLGYEIPYTAKNKQYSIWNNDANKINFFDVTDDVAMKIIEFHGDYWHCNPKQYESTYVHSIIRSTAKEIWHKDYLKIQTAINRGFQVKVVWWSDFIADPEKVITESESWIKR